MIKMYSVLTKKIKTKSLPAISILLIVYCLCACASDQTVQIAQTASIVVIRGGTYMDDGKLYVYLDGKQLNKEQPIGKGQTRTFSIPKGQHKIWVEVDDLESGNIQFTAEDNAVTFNASTERVGGSRVLLMERSMNN
jgi:hypothetical protein